METRCRGIDQMKFAYESLKDANMNDLHVDLSSHAHTDCGVGRFTLDGSPIFFQRTTEDSKSTQESLLVDTVHGGFVGKYRDNHPFGEVVWTKPVSIEGSSQPAILSRVHIDREPTVLIILSVLLEGRRIATLQAGFPLAREEECLRVVEQILQGVKVEIAMDPINN
jgi:hypothetical protein